MLDLYRENSTRQVRSRPDSCGLQCQSLQDSFVDRGEACTAYLFTYRQSVGCVL